MIEKPSPKSADRIQSDQLVPPLRSSDRANSREVDQPGRIPKQKHARKRRPRLVSRQAVAHVAKLGKYASIIQGQGDLVPFRLRLRLLSPPVPAIVRRAAKIEGRSVREYLVMAAIKAARRTIEQTQIVRLSSAEQQRFVELLANPPAPTPALDRARNAHAQLIRETP